MNDGRRNLAITGASRGIGHATAKQFSSAGWRVITCSRHPFPEGCPWEKGSEDHVQIDLADEKSLREGIQSLRKRLNGSPLHALVNNAGISPKGEAGERLGCLSTDLNLWQHVFQVNFFAALHLVRGLIAELRAGRGTVVNVTSLAGSRVHPFAGTAYATSKAALAALTREMAAELGPLGIRVNAIAPGEIRTDMISPDTEARLLAEIPARRLGTPDEVAKIIYMLCSEQSSYLTGAEIFIDGGMHC